MTRPSPTSAPGCTKSASATRSCSSSPPATHALPPIDKAHKWFVTRGDLDYTALWILYAATPLARIEVIGARLLADREVIPQAMKLNPAFFQIDLHRPAQREEDAQERAGGAGRGRRLHGGARADAVRGRCSITCARWAKRARPPRSRTTSSATSTSKA